MVLAKFADTDKVKEDINEVGTSDTEILALISRSDEDASEELESVFFRLVDTSGTLPDFFVQLATELTTAYFWVKSNGTDEAKNQREEVRTKAKETLIKRFTPVEFRS